MAWKARRWATSLSGLKLESEGKVVKNELARHKNLVMPLSAIEEVEEGDAGGNEQRDSEALRRDLLIAAKDPGVGVEETNKAVCT